MTLDPAFQRGLSLGNMGEVLVCSYLKSRGAGVIPSYDFNGKDGSKAPRPMFETRGFVIPDLDVSKGSKRFWVEVKTYHGPTRNFIHNCQVHGIPGRNYEHYSSVEKETGTPVWICILELDSGDLLSARLSGLEVWPCTCARCRNSNPEACRGALTAGVYWPRDAMTKWHTFAPSEIEPIRAAKAA
jgi:hypothetical protein